MKTIVITLINDISSRIDVIVKFIININIDIGDAIIIVVEILFVAVISKELLTLDSFMFFLLTLIFLLLLEEKFI